MKTPLRGEMLRGADFIIGVVSARGSDPFQTIFCHGARPTNYFVHEIVAAVRGLNISGDRKTSILGNSDTLGVLTAVMPVRRALGIYAFAERAHLFQTRSKKKKKRKKC